MALGSMDRLLNLYNSCDRSLKHYDTIVKGSSPQPLGRTGIAGINKLGEARWKITQYDVCKSVGRKHGFDYQLASPVVVNKTRAFIFAGHPLIDPTPAALPVPSN